MEFNLPLYRGTERIYGIFAVDIMYKTRYYIRDITLRLFFIHFQLMLYLLNVLTLNEEAEAVLSCPTSSPVPGTTGQLSKCQHVRLSDAWLYIFAVCLFP